MRRHIVTATAVVLLSGGALSVAAEQAGGAKPQSMEGHSMSMEGGMMDMMNMMGTCQRMMNGGMSGGLAVPQLPPGNEKLQLQMQAEMMQKLGEITAKYAGQIK